MDSTCKLTYFHSFKKPWWCTETTIRAHSCTESVLQDLQDCKYENVGYKKSQLIFDLGSIKLARTARLGKLPASVSIGISPPSESEQRSAEAMPTDRPGERTGARFKRGNFSLSFSLKFPTRRKLRKNFGLRMSQNLKKTSRAIFQAKTFSIESGASLPRSFCLRRPDDDMPGPNKEMRERKEESREFPARS